MTPFICESNWRALQLSVFTGVLGKRPSQAETFHARAHAQLPNRSHFLVVRCAGNPLNL